MIKLFNDFHNTEVTLRLTGSYLSAYQVKKAWKVLCGSRDCSCGNIMGMRGIQTARVIGQDYRDGDLIPKFAV
jgi:hypothetical protein